MKRSVAAAITSVLISALLVPGVVTAGGGGLPRLPVCHLNDDGGFNLINVAYPAYDNHISHGDAAFHDPVPGQPGYVFDESCLSEPILLRITSLDANGEQHMLAQWEDTNADGEPSVGDTIRTGELPQFATPTTWTYIPAYLPEHVVTAIDSLFPATNHSVSFRLWADAALPGYPSTAAPFFFQRDSLYEIYREALPNGAYSSSAFDRSDDSLQGDVTLVCFGSPSRPHPGATCTQYANGDWTVDLIQIAYYGTW